MASKTEIICDQCGKDLTYTGYSAEYRLVLGSEPLAPWFMKDHADGGALKMMSLPRPVDRTYHFCKLKCMDAWRDAAREKARKQDEWRLANRKEVGVGTYTYPPMPDELK